MPSSAEWLCEILADSGDKTQEAIWFSEPVCVCVCVCVRVCERAHALSHVTLCDSMDYSPPGSSVPGILRARILEWVATFSSRGFSQPRDPNSSLLDWQVDSLPLSHPESPFSEPE